MQDGGSLSPRFFESLTQKKKKGLLKIHPLQFYLRLALTMTLFILYILPGLSFLFIVRQSIVVYTLVF